MNLSSFRSGIVRIDALDPGGTTGVAMFEQEIIQGEWIGKPKFDFLQLGPEPHHSGLFTLLELRFTFNHHIVCESFQNRGMDKRIEAAELIGVVKLSEQIRELKSLGATSGHVHWQTASVIKGNDSKKIFWTDDKVKHLGLWVPGQRHAMDALKHLLHYMTFTLKDERWIRVLK